MAAFATIGEKLQTYIGTFSSDLSSTLITQLTPFLIVCVTLYICFKGYMFMSGRAENSIPDTVITLMKIGMIGYFFVNTGNYVHYGIDFIKSVQGALLGAIPHPGTSSITSPWQQIDYLWETVLSGLDPMMECYSKVGIFDKFSFALMVTITLFLYLIIAAYLTFSCLGILILSTIALEIVLGFGPLFCGLLMFPLTRSWFDGWIKACLTYVFTMVIMTAVVALVISVMSTQITDFSTYIDSISKDFSSDQFKKLLNDLFTLLIISFAITTLIKQVPSMAAGVVGGVAMQAVGLGAMLSGVGGGALKLAGGTAFGGAMAAKMLGKEGAANFLGKATSMFNGYGFAGRAAEAMSNGGKSNEISKRAQRVIDAATK